MRGTLGVPGPARAPTLVLVLLLALLLAAPLAIASPSDEEAPGLQWTSQGPWLHQGSKNVVAATAPGNGPPLMVATQDHLFFFSRDDPIPVHAEPISFNRMACDITASNTGNLLAVRDAHSVRVYRVDGHSLDFRWEANWDEAGCLPMWFSMGGERLYLGQRGSLEARSGSTGDILWTFDTPLPSERVVTDYTLWGDRLLVTSPGSEMSFSDTAYVIEGETGWPVWAFHAIGSRWTSSAISYEGDKVLLKTGGTLRLYEEPSPVATWQMDMEDTRGRLSGAFLRDDRFAVGDGVSNGTTRIFTTGPGGVTEIAGLVPGKVVAAVDKPLGFVTLEHEPPFGDGVVRFVDTEGKSLLERDVGKIGKDRFEVIPNFRGVYVATGAGVVEHYKEKAEWEVPELRLAAGPGCAEVAEDGHRWRVTCKDLDPANEFRVFREDGPTSRDDRLEWRPVSWCQAHRENTISHTMDQWRTLDAKNHVHPEELWEGPQRTRTFSMTYPTEDGVAVTETFGPDDLAFQFRLTDNTGKIGSFCVQMEIESIDTQEAPAPGVAILLVLSVLASIGVHRRARR